MILWTLQHPAVLDALETNGRYLVEPKNIVFPPEQDSATVHLHAAYQWLISKMEARIGPPPKGAEYPIWAWYKQQGRTDGKPDMRRSGHAKPGEPLVRMKLDVPDNLVLLSDFNDWHFVLNYWHCSKTEEESVAFDLECESSGVSFLDLGNFDLDSPALRRLRRTIVNSWDYVLDVYAPRNEDWHSPWQKRSIQATFWALEKRHALSIERFTAR
ncbi:DUF3841 domain-containing protein [Gordonibacter sp. An230]|uniref:DUF3841 domain-containing protein n=1 Tax=Gordonibacter sp. An230 TaxID=1965592 RepID=UPI0013A63ABE|nr:DUF3841 domain-containing protein [Gordonibacter sp. An230]